MEKIFKPKKFYYIYLTTNLVNNKIYVGQRGCNILPQKDTSYLGSGGHINDSIKKYGKENFKKEIIEIFHFQGKHYTNEREIYWIAFYNANNKEIGYNKTTGGQSQVGMSHNQETKDLISEIIYNHPDKEKWREINIKKHTGKKQSIETIDKKIFAITGKKRSEESKKRYSESKKGDKNPAKKIEVRSKISYSVKNQKKIKCNFCNKECIPGFGMFQHLKTHK